MYKSMPDNPGITHVMFHENCYDGITAAWVAWKAGVQKENMFPLSYGAQPPRTSHPGKDAKVLMVDFSLPLQELRELEKSVDTLIVLDHHKTAKADLSAYDHAYFNESESGASLAWRFFCPTEPQPRLVQYVREHDLWQFNLPYSESVRSYIRSYLISIENCGYLNAALSTDFDRVVSEGSGIRRSIETAVETMCSQAVVKEIGGYRVPVANTTIYFSEVGSRLLELYHNAPFAAYYMDRADGKRQWGLRSRPDFDCSKVAKKLGGGGHAQASGFVTTP